MTTTIDLSFLTEEFIAENNRSAAEQQRALLERATANPPDEAAARKLLIYFVQGGSTAFAPDVWERIEERLQDFILGMIAGSLPGSTFSATPLKVFSLAAKAKRGSKGGSRKSNRRPIESYTFSDEMTTIVDDLHDSEIWLSQTDLQEALTTQWENTLGRNDKPTRWPDSSYYPKTVREIEKRLVSYLCEYKFKGAHPWSALHYASGSYRSIPWDKPNAKATYGT
jgi:hypothetical protein